MKSVAVTRLDVRRLLIDAVVATDNYVVHKCHSGGIHGECIRLEKNVRPVVSGIDKWY